jgi:hypothetical protein
MKEEEKQIENVEEKWRWGKKEERVQKNIKWELKG